VPGFENGKPKEQARFRPLTTDQALPYLGLCRVANSATHARR